MNIKKWTILAVTACCIFLSACGGKVQTETEPTEDFAENLTDPREGATEDKVYFNRQSGFFQEFDLEMYCPAEGAVIYYTTDGTIPNKNSIKYEGPVRLVDRTDNPEQFAARRDYNAESDYVPINRIVKGHVIRAAAFFKDGTMSEVTNGTFIIGQNRRALYGDAPVISLITDPDNLFNDETGILILGNRYKEWLAENPNNKNEPDWKVQGNFSNKGKDWERPVAFEYIPTDGSNISADMGLRTKGGSTRTYLQKSLKLYAREEYGTKSIKAELIPGNMASDGTELIDKYKTFVLRNGGNDNNFGKLRDPLIQTLVMDRHFDTQQSAPCVVFLDGEYWGLYAITEDYNDSYIEANYGIDKKNVVIVKVGEIDEGKDEDIALWEDLYEFVTFHDMSESENYEKAAQMIDIPSLIDYVALCLYVDNRDCLFDNNNWSLWRVREADGETPWSDGKWRILLYDNEYSSGIYDEGGGYDIDTISERMRATDNDFVISGVDYPLMHIFQALYQNDDFKDALILTLCDLRNNNFSPDKFKKTFDAIAPDYRKLAADSFYRYGPDWVVNWNEPGKYFEQKLGNVTKYFNGRYQEFPDIMSNAFGLGKPVKTTIKVSDAEKGNICLNGMELDFSTLMKQTFSGEYFEDCVLTLKAQPKDGGKFVKWDVNGGTILEDDGPEIKVRITKKCTIEAVFEK